jgi:hypothetical protein
MLQSKYRIMNAPIETRLVHIYCNVYLRDIHVQKYSRAPVSADSVSAVSVIRGLPRPKKKLENKRNKQFISFKLRPKREWGVTW